MTHASLRPRPSDGKKIRLPQTLKRLMGWILLSFVLFSCLASAPADAKPDPQIEAQVLEIIRQHPEVIVESVSNYRQKQQQTQQNTQQSFLKELQQNPKSVIGQSPTKGAKAGQVTLVEFSDFQCPYCASATSTVRQFIDKHTDRVTLVYKHLPLTGIHSQAMPAAQAAWAATQQGKFWEFHDALFAQQSRLGEALYTETAQTLKLDLNRFNRDRASSAATAAINQDLQLAAKLGIGGTPFFVMNGETFAGAVDLATLEGKLAQIQRKY